MTVPEHEHIHEKLNPVFKTTRSCLLKWRCWPQQKIFQAHLLLRRNTQDEEVVRRRSFYSTNPRNSLLCRFCRALSPPLVFMLPLWLCSITVQLTAAAPPSTQCLIRHSVSLTTELCEITASRTRNQAQGTQETGEHAEPDLKTLVRSVWKHWPCI